jgi:hypothetical protein
MPTAKKITITGVVVYLDLEGGIWGVIDDKKKEWLPVNMPAELMSAGAKVELKATVIHDFFAGDMWGTPVEVVSHKLRQ